MNTKTVYELWLPTGPDGASVKVLTSPDLWIVEGRRDAFVKAYAGNPLVRAWLIITATTTRTFGVHSTGGVL